MKTLADEGLRVGNVGHQLQLCVTLAEQVDEQHLNTIAGAHLQERGLNNQEQRWAGVTTVARARWAGLTSVARDFFH